MKTYTVKNTKMLDLKSIILQDVNENLRKVDFEEFHSDKFQKEVGGESYKNWTSGINPDRIIRSGEWTLVAEIKGDFDAGFYSLYKKENVYVILDGRGFDSSIYVSNEHIFMIQIEEEFVINEPSIVEKNQQIRYYDGKTVNSGCGFFMKDTKKNWNLVDKYGYDAIEMTD